MRQSLVAGCVFVFSFASSLLYFTFLSIEINFITTTLSSTFGATSRSGQCNSNADIFSSRQTECGMCWENEPTFFGFECSAAHMHLPYANVYLAYSAYLLPCPAPSLRFGPQQQLQTMFGRDYCICYHAMWTFTRS